MSEYVQRQNPCSVRIFALFTDARQGKACSVRNFACFTDGRDALADLKGG